MQEPNYHAARAAVYATVAAAFCYPDEDALRTFDDPAARDGVRSAADRLDLRDEVDAVVDAFATAEPAELASTYDRLFGIPGADGTYPVIPYEAEYTTDDDVGGTQRRVAAVAGLCGELHLEPAVGFDERWDHVVVELELMQVLAAQRAIAIERRDEAAADRVRDVEATLLGKHLAGFVPAFARDVRKTTANRCYRTAAVLLRRLVDRDRDAHPRDDRLPDPEDPREVNVDA